MSLVSVIIPTYNTSMEKLRKSIESVLCQTHKMLQIIIVDDGSNHPFAGLNKKINDPRVLWINLFKNRGVAVARNKAISSAKGEYVAFLDAGDWWAMTKIEKQLKLLSKDSDLVFVYNDTIKVLPDGRQLYMKAAHREWIYKELLVRQPVTGSCSSVLTRTDLLRQLGGFYEKNDIEEDRELWIRLSKEGDVDYISEPLSYIECYLLGSRSSNPEKKKDTILRLLNIHQNEIKKYGLWDKAWAHYYKVLAEKYFLVKKIRRGYICLFKSFCREPSVKIMGLFVLGFLQCYFFNSYTNFRIRKQRVTIQRNLQ